MFTFGRDREKEAEAGYVKSPAQIPLLMAVIDAVHDLIEGSGSEQHVREAIRVAFSEGGSGVWECAGKWLRKTAREYPAVSVLWSDLAQHAKANVRYRVAAFLNEVPPSVFDDLSPRLLNDASAKVRQMAEARVAERREGTAV